MTYKNSRSRLPDKFSVWDQVINNHVIPALEWFGERNLLPITLRTLFYRLVSLVVIPNTKNSYNKISRYVVKARKDGRIQWKGCISDENRFIVQDFYSHYYVSPDSYIDSKIISKLDQLSRENYYVSDILYRWYKQKHYIEVWIPNKGYTSWGFVYENCQRLKWMMHNISEVEVSPNTPKESKGLWSAIRPEPKQVHILYFGDFDPSGSDMDRHIKEQLEYFALLDKIDFQRIALTRQQIAQFNLPAKPEDAETLEKLQRDSRTNRFIQENGGELYAVELDALLAIAPDEFKEIVQDSVERYFDKGVYQDILRKKEHSVEAIRRLVIEKVRLWLIDQGSGSSRSRSP